MRRKEHQVTQVEQCWLNVKVTCLSSTRKFDRPSINHQSALLLPPCHPRVGPIRVLVVSERIRANPNRERIQGYSRITSSLHNRGKCYGAAQGNPQDSNSPRSEASQNFGSPKTALLFNHARPLFWSLLKNYSFRQTSLSTTNNFAARKWGPTKTRRAYTPSPHLQVRIKVWPFQTLKYQADRQCTDTGGDRMSCRTTWIPACLPDTTCLSRLPSNNPTHDV